MKVIMHAVALIHILRSAHHDLPQSPKFPKLPACVCVCAYVSERIHMQSCM